MKSKNLYFKFFIYFVWIILCNGNELTFELPDNEKMCFHEIAVENAKCGLEYQVIIGGNYDVDVEITNPFGQNIYKEIKKQYDSFQWVAEKPGEYKICFGNEFSTFTHKLVYFDLSVGNDEDTLEETLDGKDKHHTALTQMETSSVSIHENLKTVIDYQTHHRLREAQGEEFAESLNERVSYWSMGQAVVIFLVGIGQIIVLRSFFTDRK